jgi:pimeloyl-ACP methyl ester carboxylesterase
MWTFVKRALGVILVVVLGWGVTGIAMASGSWETPPRGERVDIGGRSLRVICEGTARPGVPTVIFEAGAYSGAADWGYVQPIVSEGGRTCSYDRAGFGWSDVTEGPRSPMAMADDLHTLLDRIGEHGPIVLAGHSMAGILMRVYAYRYPENVVGMVLVDAADPRAISIPEAARWISRAQRTTEFAAFAAGLGLVKPFQPFFANKIGLSGVALDEKKRMFGTRRTMRTASREISSIALGGADAMAADIVLARIPIAVITAGPSGSSAWKDSQRRAASLSPNGSSVNVDDATHTSLLGPRSSAAVIEGINRVRAAATVAPQIAAQANTP